MAAEVASAYVSLLPSARGFGTRLESEIGGDVDKAGDSLGRRLGAGIGRAAAATASALGAVAVAAGTVGIRTAAQLEQAEIGFTTMLGSGEKAKAFLEDLSRFAAKTPFELPELQTAASSLVSVGVSADKVIPIMTSLGNATSGMGTGSEGIKRATVALQQMNAAGRITGEDLNQLRDAGIPVYDLLAAATGKSVEAVSELAQKGKLGRQELEQLMGALESGAGLERFTGLMETQSQSLNGVWSTLKDTFSMGMADAIQPLVPLIKQGLGGATAFVAAKMPVLKDAIAGVVVGAQGLYDLIVKGDFSGKLTEAFGWQEDSTTVDRILDIRDAVTGLYALLIGGDYTGALSRAFGWEEDSGAVDVLFNIRDAVIAAGAAVKQFFSDPTNTSALSESFSSVGDSVSKLIPAVQAFLAQMPSLSDVVAVGATALGFLADHADLLVKAMPFIVAGLILFKGAQGAANVAMLAAVPIRAAEIAANFALASSQRALAFQLGVLTGVQRQSTLAAIASGIASKAQAIYTGLVSAATAIYTGITQRHIIIAQLAALATYGQSTAFGTLTLAQKAAVVVQGLVTAAQWAWNAALSANPIGIVVIAIAALVAALIYAWNNSETFRNVVMAAWEGIQTAVSAVVSWFTTTVPALWDNITTWTKTKWEEILSFFRGIPGKIVNFFLNWTLPGLLIKHWDTIREGAVSGFTAVVEFVKSVPDRILAALGNLGMVLLSVGGDLMQGLIQGIKDKVSGAVRAVKEAVTAVIDGAKDLLGIASPSKVFMQIGAFTGEGLALGIDGQRQAVQDAMNSILDIPTSRTLNANLGAVGNLATVSAGSRGGDTYNVYEATSPEATSLAISRRQTRLGAA